MMRTIINILLIMTFLAFTGCLDRTEQNAKTGRISKEQLAEINRQLLIKDRERIINYIDRKGLDMKETDTGLWYSESVRGMGSISNGDNVTLQDGLMKFRVGKSDIPSGLNEGVKLLGKGSEAVLILPGYIGYGLIGDENKIPARSILVYNIKVIEVN
jgi:FKBP-type peptidyl-prolyl cis-trans isomerase FkpA